MVEKIRGRKEERFDRRNRTYRVCDPSKLANGKRYFANPVILIRHKVQRPFAKLRCLIAINRVMTGSGQLTLPRPASVSVRERGARTYDVCIHGTGHRIYIYIYTYWTDIRGEHVTHKVDAWNWRFCFPISISERRWGAFNWDWRCWVAVATLLMATKSSIDSNGTR